MEKTANMWRAAGRRCRLELKHFQRHVMTDAVLHGDDIVGWHGEIRDGKVVEDDETARQREEEENAAEEDHADEDHAEEDHDEEAFDDEEPDEAEENEEDEDDEDQRDSDEEEEPEPPRRRTPARKSSVTRRPRVSGGARR
jgi:hypothetical protein